MVGSAGWRRVATLRMRETYCHLPGTQPEPPPHSRATAKSSAVASKQVKRAFDPLADETSTFSALASNGAGHLRPAPRFTYLQPPSLYGPTAVNG